MSLIAALAAALFGGTLIAGVGALAGAEITDPPPGVRIAAIVFQDLALVVTALGFAALTARPRGWHFGLRPTRLRAAAGGVVLTWVGFLAFSAIWISALGIKERDKLPDELGADSSTLALIAVAFVVTVLAPIAEEVFFRGFFFTALRSWRGPWVAAIITGAVFGLIHGGSSPVGYLVPLAAFGFGLCLLYWRTGSLYPCIALHALNNSLALGVTQEWGWQIPVVMVAANALIAVILLPLRGRAPSAGRPAAALS